MLSHYFEISFLIHSFNLCIIAITNFFFFTKRKFLLVSGVPDINVLSCLSEMERGPIRSPSVQSWTKDWRQTHNIKQNRFFYGMCYS